MRLKLLLSLFLLLSALLGGEKRVEIDVPTEPLRAKERLYIGSFLAVGYLPATSRYVMDAPIEGVVEDLNVRLFGTVKRGEKIVTIKSPKILEIEADYINALIERDYYRNEIKRLQPLSEAAIVPKKRYLQAKNDLMKFQTKVQFLKSLLRDWGLQPDQIKRITRTKRPDPYINLYAPITGNISDLAVHPKIYLHQGDHILTLIDNSQVLVKIALPLAIAKLLRPGEKIYINDRPAKVREVAPTVDKMTQTIGVLIDAPISILPGQKQNVTLQLPRRAFVVPPRAVVDIDGESGIFVKRGKGFIFVPVRVLSRTAREVFILSDRLKEGDLVATSNVISLKGAWEAGDD
ncbi:MAG: HlyD family efflux transporter periplasmic adaptor subunit [Epsilonproteobacteria bacterium]|nr:HlyD family efflux transporter periplasmic adaptor subunit [Campylobacterota bacterium]